MLLMMATHSFKPLKNTTHVQNLSGDRKGKTDTNTSVLALNVVLSLESLFTGVEMTD